MSYEDWVMEAEKHLPRLMKEANEYQRAQNKVTAPEYLDHQLTHSGQIGFVHVDIDDEFIDDIKIPRSWFIDPNWRRRQEAEFEAVRQEAERLNQERQDRLAKERWAQGHIATMRELHGLEAAQKAHAEMVERGWLRK